MRRPLGLYKPCRDRPLGLSVPSRNFTTQNRSHKRTVEDARPYRNSVTVHIPVKSKFSVRSAKMRRICTGLGRGRRHICVANGRPVCIQLRRRAVEAPAPTGIMQIVRIPINQNLPFGRQKCEEFTPTSVGGGAFDAPFDADLYVVLRFTGCRGASPYRDNKTVHLPDKSKFSGRSSRNAKNLHRPW